MSLLRRLVVLPAVLMAVACGGATTPTSQVQPSETPLPTSTTATPLAPAPAVHVYFLREEKAASVHRIVPVAYGLGARAAVRSLLNGPTSQERSTGLSTTIPATSRLLGLTIKNGTAEVNLNAAYESGGGSMSMSARLMQVVYTLTQFAPVQHVTFVIEGKRVSTFGGEGIVLDHPVTRMDYRSFLPRIFVDSPAIGETVTSPLPVHGSASVFEGDFVVEVTTGSGESLARKHVHTRMGRAEFTTTLRFPSGHTGPARVTAFDFSARDGSRIDEYVVPVTLG